MTQLNVVSGMEFFGKTFDNLRFCKSWHSVSCFLKFWAQFSQIPNLHEPHLVRDNLLKNSIYRKVRDS